MAGQAILDLVFYRLSRYSYHFA